MGLFDPLCIAPFCARDRSIGSMFCDTHVTASSGQRGGWLSAYKRRKIASSDMHYDASNIMKRLWIGAKPPFEHDLPNFDVIALCAAELQPPRTSFHGKTIRCGFGDVPMLSRAELNTALTGAKQVAAELAAGKRVLVTCQMGLNRSALVTGLAMGMRFDLTAPQIVNHIRSRRSPQALFNDHFVELLEKFVGQIRTARAQARRRG